MNDQSDLAASKADVSKGAPSAAQSFLPVLKYTFLLLACNIVLGFALVIASRIVHLPEHTSGSLDAGLLWLIGVGCISCLIVFWRIAKIHEPRYIYIGANVAILSGILNVAARPGPPAPIWLFGASSVVYLLVFGACGVLFGAIRVRRRST